MFDEALTTTIACARQHALGDLLRRSAVRRQDKTALVYHEVRHTYAELDATVNRTANALAIRGVAKGDRVALLSHNNAGYVVVTLALARLGAIAVPVNFMLTAGEVAYILEHAGASAVVVEDALLPVMQEALETADREAAVTVRGVLGSNADGLPDGWEPLEAWSSHDDFDAPQVAIADDDVLQLMYTSGTESQPKGVMMTSRSPVSQYVSCLLDGRFAAEDVALHALPLFHVAAQHCFLMPNIYLGAPTSSSTAPIPRPSWRRSSARR